MQDASRVRLQVQGPVVICREYNDHRSHSYIWTAAKKRIPLCVRQVTRVEYEEDIDVREVKPKIYPFCIIWKPAKWP